MGMEGGRNGRRLRRGTTGWQRMNHSPLSLKHFFCRDTLMAAFLRSERIKAGVTLMRESLSVCVCVCVLRFKTTKEAHQLHVIGGNENHPRTNKEVSG